MSYFKEAEALSEIIKMRGLSQSALAKSMGVSQSYVANKLRLLKLSEPVRDAVLVSGLSERHARALLRLDSPSEQLKLIEKIVTMHLNVRESEVLIDGAVPRKEARREVCPFDEKEIRAELETSISSALKALRRLGRVATHAISFYQDKRYITICIEEF